MPGTDADPDVLLEDDATEGPVRPRPVDVELTPVGVPASGGPG